MRRVPAIVLLSRVLMSVVLLAGIAVIDSPTPLDLPAGGPGRAEDDEDAPELITFYGNEFEGDGFYWCLDTSYSMSGDDRLATLQAEVSSAIAALSARAQFSLVAFNSTTNVWSPTSVRATAAHKATAIGWVQGLTATGWTCLAPAGVAIVEIANDATARSKSVFVVGDGQPVCDGADTGAQCLTEITAANWRRLPIHTLYVASDSAGIAFMQALAAANDGSFVLVD